MDKEIETEPPTPGSVSAAQRPWWPGFAWVMGMGFGPQVLAILLLLIMGREHRAVTYATPIWMVVGDLLGVALAIVTLVVGGFVSRPPRRKPFIIGGAIGLGLVILLVFPLCMGVMSVSR